MDYYIGLVDGFKMKKDNEMKIKNISLFFFLIEYNMNLIYNKNNL